MYKIEVMGFNEAFNYVYSHSGRHGTEKFAIISIQEYSKENMGIMYKEGGNLKAALNIHFSDIDKPPLDKKANVKLISAEDAMEIRTFVDGINERGDIDLLIVHCFAGVSRSAAVAAAILKACSGDDSQIFSSRNYAPNMYVYRKVLSAYGMENDGSAFMQKVDGK